MFRTRVILTVSLLALCVGLTAQAGDPPNYALNGTATQSTMDWGGVPENGINGNLGDFTHTAADDADKWWEVDLGDIYELKEILVYNRASCCGERLDGVVVKALDADRNEIYVSDPVAGAVTADVHVFDNDGAGFAAVRYIRLEGGTDFLSIGELQAFPYWPFAYGPEPADGAVDVDTTEVQWIPADAAVAHNVYLGTDPNAMDLVAEGDGAASQAAVTLEPGVTYFWRVDAVDADGVVSEGDVWSFDTLPLEAHFPSPYDDQGNVLSGAQLSWTAGKGVLLHNVYFGTDPEALTPTMYLSETSLDPGPLEADTTYYWRVDEFTGITTNVGPLWSFTTPAAIEVTDPNLLIYYNFESGAHTTALDQSGHGNHAAFMRTPEWATGIAGGCLAIERDDGDYIETVMPLGIVSNTVTVTGWVKHEASPQAWSGILTHRRADGNLGLQHDGNELRYMWGADSYWWVSSGLKIPNGEWYFAALAVAPDQAKLYLDGVGATYTNVDVHIPVTFDSGIRVARDHTDDRIMTCLIDEVRLYDKTLTDEEILEVMVLDPAQAQVPTPGNRTTLDPEDAMTLSWVAGEGAFAHYVYLSTDAELVAASDPNVQLGMSGETSMTLAEPLVRGATYYWKVDEMAADASIVAGRVWSFTLTDINTESWAAAMAVAEPNFVATHVAAGVYDIGELGGEITYEFVVRANPDEQEVSMALIGRIGTFGATRAALKFEQWNNTGNYGATHFGVMDYDFGVANTLGEYVHLVFVSSEAAGTTALYVDGVYQASVDGAITLGGIVGIGNATRDEEGAAVIDPFDGTIFGVAIFAGALSDEEIQAHADAYFTPVKEPVFVEDFEAYAAGSDLHGQGGWKGWDNTAGAGAPVSDAVAVSGAISAEIGGGADLVHEFSITGGKWVFSTMQYIPAGTTGENWFILLNQYSDTGSGGPDKDWSLQYVFNLETGVVTSQESGGTADIVYDEWVELMFVIDLDNNSAEGYYNGALVGTQTWDDTEHATIGAVDLYGAGASSIYYDDIIITPF